ncbi:MAG: VOC family protein [Acidobacteriia bacterium]|nr:VOC family protein [Terriglobia bacterium]
MTGHQAEQFDQAVQAMLDGRGEQPAEFRELLEVCARLRDLPRFEFQLSLEKALERMNPMTATTPYRREGFKTVTPFILVPQPDKLLDFLEAAFGAQVTHRGPAPNGGFHGEARLGQAMLMVGGGDMAVGRELRASLHYFVDDVDAAYRRAIAAGAKVFMGEAGEPADRPYGERSAFVEDPFGNQWFLARHLGPEGERPGEMTPYLYPESARGLIAFLEKAFGAEGLGVYEHEGRVMHAVRLGDSLVEMGEGPPFGPQALSLYVEDPDAMYERALAAGATSLWEPKDQPYGERTAGVRDPFGNQWFPGRRIQ